jgi:tyrosine aminotransferase
MVSNPDLPLIGLHIGDPTTNPDLKPTPETTDAIIASIKSNKFNGYLPSAGALTAREAVAKYWLKHFPKNTKQTPIHFKDVFITSGATQALDLCMTALSEPGSNILVPKPGFPIYKTLSSLIGVEIKYYKLLPQKNWEIDLEHMESMIDDKTCAIVYNNPSNPCGSVYTEQHIKDFLAVVHKHSLTVIADEIYEDIVFPGNTFYPCASFNTEVPVLSCSAVSKRFLIPGWRLGWIVIHDKCNRFNNQLHKALNYLCQRLIVPNSTAQGALADILANSPNAYFDNLLNFLHSNARLAYDGFNDIPGLKPIMPLGSMYIMVEIDLKSFPNFDSDIEFIKALVKEQSVFCYPGTHYEYPGYMRIVLSVPTKSLTEALNRIKYFCDKYHEN